jgi:hypothetical protein
MNHSGDRNLANLTKVCVMTALNLLVETGALDMMPLKGSITTKSLATVVGIDESAISRPVPYPKGRNIILIISYSSQSTQVSRHARDWRRDGT